jgi:tetratricopeptide (TPR) repeat protein
MQRDFKFCRLLLLCSVLPACAWAQSQSTPVAEAERYYQAGECSKTVDLLKSAAGKDASNGDVELLLTKCYLQLKQTDAAVNSGEKAVAINPINSEYHRWLGEAYGEKADHASMFSAYGLARKTQKEFDTAVQLDEHNFDAAQDLVEYDCTAPSVVNGGEEKAQPIIQKLMTLDVAEGHYAAGNCKAVKKDYAAADSEFTKALENKLKSLDRVYDIADYLAQRGQGEKVSNVVEVAQAQAPQDPRVNFYHAVAFILKKEKLADAEKLLKQYLQDAPKHPGDPTPVNAHYWLGRGYEAEKNMSAARAEYEAALKLDGKYKPAQEGLKRLGNS